MPQKDSAGILLFRRTTGVLEVLLGHPGGPYWARKDEGAWSIPKGGIDPGEQPIDAAVREFREETGIALAGAFIPMGFVTMRSGKRVHAWALEGDCDPATITSAVVTIEWPPRSGRRIEVPEIDRVQFFTIADARRAIHDGQQPLLDRLLALYPR